MKASKAMGASKLRDAMTGVEEDVTSSKLIDGMVILLWSHRLGNWKLPI